MPKFITYPKAFGIYLHPTKRQGANEGDLEVLKELQHRVWERRGGLISWKKDLQPIMDEVDGLHSSLTRLWNSNIIDKFATQFHTQSNRPEYISYFIWGDDEE